MVLASSCSKSQEFWFTYSPTHLSTQPFSRMKNDLPKFLVTSTSSYFRSFLLFLCFSSRFFFRNCVRSWPRKMEGEREGGETQKKINPVLVKAFASMCISFDFILFKLRWPHVIKSCVKTYDDWERWYMAMVISESPMITWLHQDFFVSRNIIPRTPRKNSENESAPK